MRGHGDSQQQLFYSIDVESRIRRDHPLRTVKRRVDRILAEMNETFAGAYHKLGRPGIPPERLLKALLLKGLCSVRSERQLVERIDTDLLFRWFLDMNPEEDSFDHSAISKNRKRFEEHGIAGAFFDAVLREAMDEELTSDDHFSIDGTMIESMASMKSFRPINESDEEDNDNQHDGNSFQSRNPDVDFHGKKRSNETHRSRTDPEARLYRKGPGKPAQLCHMGHVLSENRNGLIVEACVTQANGKAESDATVELVDRYITKHGGSPKTVGADKGYDEGPLLREMEDRSIEPHFAMRAQPPADPEKARADRKANIEARLRMQSRQKTPEYSVSQRFRKKVEECFGWIKTIGGLSRSHWPDRWKLEQQFTLNAAAYNLVRMNKLKPL